MTKKSCLDLDGKLEFCWPKIFRPCGESTLDKEPFDIWWNRNRRLLSHLPADLCEQWVYRHWAHSPFGFLPLDTLQWKREKWEGAALLSKVYRAWGGDLSPQFDYDTFQRQGGDDRHQTAIALDAGTWDYPMVVLSTPYGVRNSGKEHLGVRFVIVEGHQRHRYLNALHFLGRPPTGPHEVIILHTA